MLYLGAFELKFEKAIFMFENQLLELAKFQGKMKILKFRAKNVLFGGFLGCNLKMPLAYLKSAQRICLIANFGAKMKILKPGTQNALFRYFGLNL